MADGSNCPAWETFRELVDAGDPVVFPLAGEPGIRLFVSPHGNSIGMRVPAGASPSPIPSPLQDVDVALVSVDGTPVYEVSTSRSRLFEEFYKLLTSLVDRLQNVDASLDDALRESLRRWNDLLTPVDLLSQDEQVGLWGELWALERLVRAKGPGAVQSWTGPLGEPHDLRIGSTEIEVKTTTTMSRHHMISGLAQLVPSLDHDLYLLSLQVEPPGADSGQSLAALVRLIRDLLAGDPALNTFDDRLRRAAYLDDKALHYATAMQLRTPAALVPVDAAVPALTHAALNVLGPAYATRIREVHYRLDVSGLGFLDGTAEFLAILPLKEVGSGPG